ncbi:MAG: SUMF1/EgtB/PvdO family nonheme iron enzyme [Kiritimatiellae bacterium]|nr:SUMF1/EgtB/PvdO family nonheme iron enzyme [Kiritimatiellia bacterium]
MNATKTMTMLAAVAVGLSAQALTLAVKDVKIAQRYPWNGLVDIDYTVECDDKDADVYVYPVGYDVDMNLSVPPRTLAGDGANGKAVEAGTHRMTWDMAKDMGENYNRAKFSMKVHAYAGAAPYMIVNFDERDDQGNFPISYASEIPTSGAEAIPYKTTKLALKLIPPGTFWMGSPADEPYRGRNSSSEKEQRRQVTLTQPFYCAIYELTGYQYAQIMGETSTSMKPVDWLTYNTIRGSSLGSKWPEHQQVDASSIVGQLRSKTGVTFDLPTEAQWEYACRAGTDTPFNNNTANSYGEVCYSRDNSYYDPKEVGLLKPNAFGLYDMHGNVHEFCLDWYISGLCPNPYTDPKGANSGSYRVVKGGSVNNYWYDCRSASVRTYSPGDADRSGCRLVALPAAK